MPRRRSGMKALLVLSLLCLSIALVEPAEAISPTCLPGPFPATPQTPLFRLDLTATFGSDQAHLDLWREPCTDGSGQTAALVRLTPLSPSPSICSFNLVLLQNGEQFYGNLIGPPGSFVLCDKLFIPGTFILKELSESVVFNAANAFTFINDGNPIVQVSVSALSPADVPLAIAVVGTGCTTCHSGQSVGYNATIVNPGAPRLVELKGGVRFPDGTILGLVSQEQAVLNGESVVTIIPSTSLPAGLPTIDLIVEAALLEPELGVTLTRHGAPLHLLP